MRLAPSLEALLCTAALGGGGLLEVAPRIDHVGLECIEPGTYAVVLSGIDPGADIQTAKVYFRSALYPDFYYVEMTPEKDGFVEILPQASPETPRVIYYVEAIDQSFESARSPEFDPPVEDPCDDRPTAAYLPGESPGIVVGAISSGASPLPPGFSAVGIVGTITALGVSSGIGGGIGAGTAVAVAAGVGGGVAGAVVVAQTQETTSTTAAATSTAGVTTTAIASPGSPTTTASTSTVPGTPASTTSSTSTSVPGGPTTTTADPAGTTTSGASTTTTPVPPSTTVPVTSTVAAGPLNPDCFTVEVLGECRVRLDATCVNPPVDRYDWVLDTEDNFKKETVSNGPASFTFRWDEGDCDEDEDVTFFLEVRRGGSRASAQKTFRVPGNGLAISTLVRTEVSSQLDVPGAEGRLILNGVFVRAFEAHSPVSTRVEARRGGNEIEAVLVRASGEAGTWRFELPESSELRVVEGTVHALEPRAVVFRLSGTPGERVRFRFVLER